MNYTMSIVSGISYVIIYSINICVEVDNSPK